MFEDPASLQRIPPGGVEVVVPAAGMTKEQHEIGLEDLERLSQSVDYEEGYEFPTITPEKKVKVIGCRITRAGQSVTRFNDLY